jgi:membrane associated rhomboid family serine protease
MRPLRSSGGFNLPQLNTMAAKLLVAMVGSSALLALARGVRDTFFLLNPGAVFGKLMLWQPLTYAFIALSPVEVLFGGMIIWWAGHGLEQIWGSRRLLAFAVGVTALAGAVTVLLALVIPSLQRPFHGSTVMTGALWVAFGLSIGRGQTNFWGIPITGNMLAAIGAGFVVLWGIFGSWSDVVPEAIALGLSYAYLRGVTPRFVLLRFQSWRVQRQVKARSKHLRVVAKDRNTPKGSDRYLH